jgi:drug/metabolite transporter (DMT)-like permease
LARAVPGLSRPTLVLAGVCLGWGTIPVTVSAVDLPGPAITAARVWLASIGLVVAGRLLRSSEPPATLDRKVGVAAAIAGVLLAVHWSMQFAAYDRAPAPTVAFVIFLAPVGYAALAPFVLREHTPPRAWLGLGLAVPGAALITGASSADGASSTGIALAFGAAVTLVGLTLAAKRVAQAYGGRRSALIQLTIAGVALSPIAIKLVTGGYGSARAEWLWLVVLGLVHTAVAVSMFLWALARTPVAVVGVLSELEPVGVTLVAALLGDLPGPATLVGGALIVVAGVVAASAPHSAAEEVAIAVPG